MFCLHAMAARLSPISRGWARYKAANGLKFESWQVLVLGLPGVTLFSIGVPIFSAWFIWRNQAKLREKGFVRMYSFIYGDYKVRRRNALTIDDSDKCRQGRLLKQNRKI
jgi:hypothetical protein